MDHQFGISYSDIVLRPLRREDIEQLRVWRNDAENSRYIRKIPEITPEAQQLWFEDYLHDETSISFAIEHENSIVGSVALYDIVAGSAEFGRLMIGAAKGKGIGGKSTAAVLKIAFEGLGLETVTATVSIDNTAALVIYSRIGFCIVGRKYNELARMDEFELSISSKRFASLN